MTPHQRLEEIEERVNQRGHHGVNVYDIGSVHASRDIAFLTQSLRIAIDALEFYSQGGHPAMDMWEHKDLGYFTGKRARHELTRISELAKGEK